ncbi:MAG: heme exporter protein CcmD [Actinobacteria bacterium]|nr:heme exporter protein CcmD [Actinomycetota bacterium]
MEDVGFIATSYVMTFAALVALAVTTWRAGKHLSREVSDEDKPWT